MNNLYDIWKSYFAAKHAWLQKEFESSLIPADLSGLETILANQLESKEDNPAILKLKVAYALSAELANRHVNIGAYEAYKYLQFYLDANNDTGCVATATDAAYSITDIVVPVCSLEGKLVTGIASFSGSDRLLSIQLPKSLKSIQEDAFSGCARLRNIIYDGTVDEWKKISKGENWNLRVPAKVVHCTDGNVSIND